MPQHDTLVAWLKDAYSMEAGAIPALERFAATASSDAALHSKLEEHLAKTRGHADKLRACLHRFGQAAPQPTPWPDSPATGNRDGDGLIKHSLAGFAAEQFEIATYKALLVAAQAADDFQTLAMCEEILDDEEDMARWLEDHLPPAVHDFVLKGP